MKSNEELNELKVEPETESENPQELTDEELEQVTGGLAAKRELVTGGFAAKFEQVKAGFKEFGALCN